MSRPHACHMIQKDIWGVSKDNICKGSKIHFKKIKFI